MRLTIPAEAVQRIRQFQEGNTMDTDTLAYISRLERERAELIEALRGQHAALSVTLAAVDAAATGATLTSTDGYASNIRTEARKQLQSVSALLSRLGAE